MWGLEYALLFGAPENKLELLEGHTPLSWPFPDRETAEAHFADWTETLCRWQDVSKQPGVQKTDKKWTVEVNGFVIELHCRPIHLEIPFDWDAFHEIHRSFWRDLWPGQPAERGRGSDGSFVSSDIAMNLWKIFEEIRERYHGLGCGRVAIALSDRDAVEPDEFVFRADRQGCMIEDHYFYGVPDVVASVLSPATRWLDRGPRREVFRRAGVRQLWLVEPLAEEVELYELAGGDYELLATYGGNDTFVVPGFPEVRVNVAELFDTQRKRHQRHHPELGDDVDAADEPSEPVSKWLIPRDTRLGLAYLMVLGHPKRRFEIWDNRAPCMLAFGSDEEARVRFGDFLEDIRRWEQSPPARPSALDASTEIAEVGRFRLTRRGRIFQLDVAVDARKYRELLEVSAHRESWDWGQQ